MGKSERSRPSKVTRPESGLSMPSRQLKSVVFPAPFGPTSPTASAPWTDREMESRATIPPNRFEMFVASSKAISSVAWPDHARRGRARLRLGWRVHAGAGAIARTARAGRCQLLPRGPGGSVRSSTIGVATLSSPLEYPVPELGAPYEALLLLILGHPLWVLGVLQGTEPKEERRQLHPTRSKPSTDGLEDLLDDDKPEAGVSGALGGPA